MSISNSSTNASQLAVQSTADRLKQKGYAVIVKPDPADIPIDLHQYSPDIWATRGEENLIIEIKPRGFRRSVERYKEISEMIGSHKNWRFLLSTVDAENDDIGLTDSQNITPQSLKKMLSRLERLVAGENYDLAVPFLWSVYISAMRIAGENADVPIDMTSDRSVMNYMYSLGEISSDEYDWAKQSLALRNQVVHCIDTSLSKELVLEMYTHTKQKLTEWGLL